MFIKLLGNIEVSDILVIIISSNLLRMMQNFKTIAFVLLTSAQHILETGPRIYNLTLNLMKWVMKWVTINFNL